MFLTKKKWIFIVLFIFSVGIYFLMNQFFNNKVNPDISKLPKEKSFLFDNTEIHVYRTETCYCCVKWISYLQSNNIMAKDIVVERKVIQDMREQLKIPSKLYSCHIAKFLNYHLEGHIPLKAIQYLYTQKPKNWIAISVPGMPLGSPGMESREYPSTGAPEGEPGEYKIYDIFAYYRIDGSKNEIKTFMQFKGSKQINIKNCCS